MGKAAIMGCNIALIFFIEKNFFGCENNHI